MSKRKPKIPLFSTIRYTKNGKAVILRQSTSDYLYTLRDTPHTKIATFMLDNPRSVLLYTTNSTTNTLVINVVDPPLDRIAVYNMVYDYSPVYALRVRTHTVYYVTNADQSFAVQLGPKLLVHRTETRLLDEIRNAQISGDQAHDAFIQHIRPNTARKANTAILYEIPLGLILSRDKAPVDLLRTVHNVGLLDAATSLSAEILTTAGFDGSIPIDIPFDSAKDVTWRSNAPGYKLIKNLRGTPDARYAGPFIDTLERVYVIYTGVGVLYYGTGWDVGMFIDDNADSVSFTSAMIRTPNAHGISLDQTSREALARRKKHKRYKIIDVVRSQQYSRGYIIVE